MALNLCRIALRSSCRLASRPLPRPPVLLSGWRSLAVDSSASASTSSQVVLPLQRLAEKDELPESMLQAFGRQNMSRGELNQLRVQEAVRAWQRTPSDTGSGEVQVAVFTERIMRLGKHMSEHHKDNMSKRRLQMLVSKRNRMLKYMRREQRGAYLKVIEGLRIRPNKNFDPTIKPQKQKWAGSKKKHGRGKGRPREARVYGHAKTAKGRTRLVQHGHRQRKLQRERAAAAAEAKAEASGTA